MSENYITCQAEKGSINISEEVITSVVKSAISEIEGVAGLSNTAGAEIAELIGIKTLTRGVKVQFIDERMVVITGPNGSGKSTLAKIIAGIVKPTEGQIILDGEDHGSYIVNNETMGRLLIDFLNRKWPA